MTLAAISFRYNGIERHSNLVVVIGSEKYTVVDSKLVNSSIELQLSNCLEWSNETITQDMSSVVQSRIRDDEKFASQCAQMRLMSIDPIKAWS